MGKLPFTVLPSHLSAALRRIGSKLESQQGIKAELGDVLCWLDELSPAVITRAATEISYTANLHHYRPQLRLRLFSRIFSRKLTDREQLERVRGLEYLFIFHQDGRIREAALQKIISGLSSPFMFTAVAWRLNDWALPVRAAAAECARRVFPLTDAEVIAQAAVVLLARERSWRRWSESNERTVLQEAFARTDVGISFADIISKKETGAVGWLLRCTLRQSALDPHLERLAREAVQPAARAIALQSLVDGYANWPNGRLERQWIDKSMGQCRWVPVFDQRPLERTALRTPTIMMGLADRSAAVRKVALDGLIRYQAEIPEAKDIAAPFLVDRVASVRERAAFLVRVIAETGERDGKC